MHNLEMLGHDLGRLGRKKPQESYKIIQFADLWVHMKNDSHGGVACSKGVPMTYLCKIWEPFNHGINEWRVSKLPKS